MSPQAASAVPRRSNLPAPGETRKDSFLSPRVVAREAAKVLSARGMEVRPAVLRRLVKAFIDEGHTTTEEIEPWVISYADPTGERAVGRVLRGPVKRKPWQP